METSNFNIIKKVDDKYYVFNTFSKAIVKVDKDIGMALETEELELLDTYIINIFKSNGIVVNNRINEKEILHNQYLKIRNSADNIFITLLPTMKCNFRCPYCFEGSDAKSEIQDIDFNILKKAAAKYFPNIRHVHITLFGGEPLLKWKQLRGLFLFIKKLSEKYGFSYTSSIATNAYYLNKTVCEDLLQICHAESFQITIDGCKSTHNITRKLFDGKATYRKVLDNFRQLVIMNTDDRLNLLLRVNLLNNSEDDILELLREFSDIEKKHFELYFRPIYNTKEFCDNNDNKTNLEQFYLIAKNQGFRTHYGNYIRFWHCEGDGGVEQIHIMPDLSIWKCVNNLEVKEANIGRITTRGDVILDFEKIEIWKKNDPFNDAKCSKCVLLPICWGGCPLNYLKKKERTCIYEKGFDFIETFIKR